MILNTNYFFFKFGRYQLCDQKYKISKKLHTFYQISFRKDTIVNIFKYVDAEQLINLEQYMPFDESEKCF